MSRPVALVTGSTSGIGEGIAHDDMAAATPEVWRELLDVNLVATLVHHRYLTGEVILLDGGMNLT